MTLVEDPHPSVPRRARIATLGTMVAVVAARSACGRSDAPSTRPIDEPLPSAGATTQTAEPLPDGPETTGRPDQPDGVTLHFVDACTVPGQTDATAGAGLDGAVWLRHPDAGTECLVGKAIATTGAFRQGSAQARLEQSTGRWAVEVDLVPAGRDAWNAAAAECFTQTTTCPTGQLAIVFDGVIVTASVVRQPQFADAVLIGGSFDQAGAEAVADAINGGTG